MASGIRHRTSRRWLSKSGGETPFESMAQPFASDDVAETHRESLGSFKDAWKVEPLGTIRDGEANVTQKAAAWKVVEDCQAHLNNAAKQFLPEAWLAFANTHHAFDHERDPALAAEHWRVCETAQQALNAAARTCDSLVVLVANLDGALEEYVRIGGTPNRLPGVGGLS